MVTSNYVIATYSGSESHEKIKFNKVKSAIECMLSYRNNITQITVVVAMETNPNKIDYNYIEYINSLEKLYPNFIKVIHKQNDIFLSYSSYYHAWKTYPDFDYYYFTEDDYHFSLDNFDQIIPELFANKKIDYLFAHMDNNHFGIFHPSHAITITKGSILSTVFSNFYENMEKTEQPHQIAFGIIFFNCKQYFCSDFKNTKYIAPFFRTPTLQMEMLCKKDFSSPKILMPTQYYIYSGTPFPNGRDFNYYNYPVLN